jgi:uncharacterized FlaG/YvyC family protein
MTARIWGNLSFKNEQLPKETGLGGPKIRPQEPLALVNPDVFVQNNPSVSANLGQFNPIDPGAIRLETLDKLKASVDAVNEQIAQSLQFSGIRFGVHEESGRSFAVIRDRDTGKVLKQIPAQAFLEIAGRLREASGLLVDMMG